MGAEEAWVEEFRQRVLEKPCTVLNQACKGDVVIDYVVKSGPHKYALHWGTRKKLNAMPLCEFHAEEKKARGLRHMFRVHPAYWGWLIDNDRMDVIQKLKEGTLR